MAGGLASDWVQVGISSAIQSFKQSVESAKKKLVYRKELIGESKTGKLDMGTDGFNFAGDRYPLHAKAAYAYSVLDALQISTEMAVRDPSYQTPLDELALESLPIIEKMIQPRWAVGDARCISRETETPQAIRALYRGLSNVPSRERDQENQGDESE